MTLTDGTKLIRIDPKNKKDVRALNSLKKKLESRKKSLREQIEDTNRALKTVERQLSSR